jgi:hypothetical protein
MEERVAGGRERRFQLLEQAMFSTEQREAYPTKGEGHAIH